MTTRQKSACRRKRALTKYQNDTRFRYQAELLVMALYEGLLTEEDIEDLVIAAGIRWQQIKERRAKDEGATGAKAGSGRTRDAAVNTGE